MKICLLNTAFDAEQKTTDDLEALYFHPRGLARGLIRRGHDVTLLQGFHHSEVVVKEGLKTRYLKLPPLRDINGRPVRRAEYYLPGMPARRRLREALSSIEMDVLHFFGMSLLPELWAVVSAIKAHPPKFSMSFHGGIPVPGGLIKFIQKRLFKRVGTIFFPAAEAAATWRDSGILETSTKSIVTNEVSTTYQRRDRSASRQLTGLTGEPVFLSVGLLQPRKDPIKALKIFDRIHAAWPKARFYFIYQVDDMLGEMKAWLENRQSLKQVTTFIGRVPHDELEAFYNSADFYLLSSRSEIGCNAITEAIACGVIPIASDLPSVRLLLDEGKIGHLFPAGDDRAGADAIISSGYQDLEARSHAVREYFDRQLSYDVMAKKYEEVYCKNLS